MENDFLIIHAWQLDGLGRLKFSFINQLEEKINGRYKKVAKECKLPSLGNTISRILRRKKKKKFFTKISSIFKLTDHLNIPREEVEKNIERFKISSSVGWENAKINFPLKVSPLWFRCVGVGDFTIGYNGWKPYVVWCQNSVKPMKDLIKKLINLSPKHWLGGYSGINEKILIPSVIVDVVCVLLNISRRETKTERYISTCLRLSKSYRFQILAQTLVDEGYCDKIHSRISIHMKDKKIIEALHILCKSLGYKTTIVTRNTGKYKDNEFYDLLFGIVDTFKFYEDLNLMIKKYGKFAGLWKKQISFIKIVKKDSEHVKSYKIKCKILELIKQRGTLNSKELRKTLNLSRVKFHNSIANLKKEGLIKSLKHGVYVLS